MVSSASARRALWLLASLIGTISCASLRPVELPLYRPSGVIVGSGLVGRLEVVDGCMFLVSLSSRTLPLWPPGSHIMNGAIVVPLQDGSSRTLTPGRLTRLRGAPLASASPIDPLARVIAERCGSPLFSVEFLAH